VTQVSTAVWRSETYRRLATRLDRLVGPRTAALFEPLKVRTVFELLHHLPRRYVSGTELSDLSTLRPGEEVAVLAEVVGTQTFGTSRPADSGRRGGFRGRLEATITDRRGKLALTFFGQPKLIAYWQKQLVTGSRGIFAGKVTEFNGRLQLAHPDFVILDEDGNVVGGAQANAALASAGQGGLVGLYPATGKLRTWTIAATVQIALDSLADCADPLPDWIRAEAGVPELEAAFRAIHQPQTREGIENGVGRLRFDEAFALQLTMARRRADAARRAAVPRLPRAGGLLDAFDAKLPFTLTQGQVEVSEVLMAELGRDRPMQRLLQGEVGSGKTLVAVRAMLAVIDSGGQAALLAPTEVLAAQHYQTITALMGELAEGGTLAAPEHSTGVVLLTGSTSTVTRREALDRIASGEAGIVIGTHALLGNQVTFSDLGLVVVDEQHRFGVEQRAALAAKATTRPHVLVMTATPIPRSVAMTVFGDLETSTLRELPAGRAEVSTVVIDAKRRPAWVERAWARVAEEVAQGRQAYVVCARISSAEKSETRGGTPPAHPPQGLRPDPISGGAFGGLDPELGEEVGGEELEPAVAAEDLYAELSAGPLAGVKVELLHGQLPAEQKDAVMRRFAAGETDVLVSTTVIEVGVDVPNASVMVISDADRFGISQLHQLRGRIGRGGHPGICLLISRAPEDSLARARLDAVAATRDGFALAEIDLEQRREGNVLGAEQSGERSSLRLLRVLADAELIASARSLAERCVAADPELSDPGLADVVSMVELQAAGEWLDRT
jgi:ATP-dependent DNA helicase RecG